MYSRRRPPRIAGFAYLGPNAYFVTVCVDDRRPAFDESGTVSIVRERLLTLASRDHFTIFAYCFMPDHLHVLAQGEREDADLTRWVHAFKQHSGYDYAQVSGRRLWQKGFYDTVLRDEDAMQSVAAYIVANPVRAGLCEAVTDYPHSGSSVYDLAVLAASLQWRPRRACPRFTYP